MNETWTNNAKENDIFDTEKSKKIARLKHRMSLYLRMFGLTGVTVNIGFDEKTSCHLTQDGIIISLNPEAIDRLADRQWFGTQGNLPERAASILVIVHEIFLARDFIDSTFRIDTAEDNRISREARSYFINSVNNIFADAYLKNIPYTKRYLSAYISRQVRHLIEDAPLHIQFMIALHIYLMEETPILKTSDAIARLFVDDQYGILQKMTAALSTPSLTYREKHRIAEDILGAEFIKLFNQDMRAYSSYQLFTLYDQFQFYGEINIPESDDYKGIPTRDIRQRAQQLYNLFDDKSIDRLLEDRYEHPESTTKEEVAASLLSLPKTIEKSNLAQSGISTESYGNTLARWFGTIRQVADVFIKLASPKEFLTVPRFALRKAFRGRRFHPGAMVEAMTQLQIKHERPIWQPTIQVSSTEYLSFAGLDVYLLLDVSGSMQGKNASYASAMSTCLIEGLRLARHQVEIDSKQPDVDVRIQLLAFGSGWAELTPLCKEPTFSQKEAAFYNLLHPQSDQTMVSGALKHVRRSSTQYPFRDSLCLVVSDGLFSDNLMAYKTVQTMPAKCYVGHINIGELGGIPITEHFETIEDPAFLPGKLKSILEAQLEKTMVE